MTRRNEPHDNQTNSLVLRKNTPSTLLPSRGESERRRMFSEDERLELPVALNLTAYTITRAGITVEAKFK